MTFSCLSRLGSHVSRHGTAYPGTNLPATGIFHGLMHTTRGAWPCAPRACVLRRCVCVSRGCGGGTPCRRGRGGRVRVCACRVWTWTSRTARAAAGCADSIVDNYIRRCVT